MRKKLKIYVAGRTNMLDEVRTVQNILKVQGHVITHDWCAIVEEVGGAARDDVVEPAMQRQFAENDLRGVIESDCVVAVCGPGWTGTLVEVGFGLSRGKPIILYGEPERHSVFWHLPQVKTIPADPRALKKALGEVAESSNV